MDVFEATKKRRSIRNYLDKPVEEETLAKILDAARLAPSAVNLQPCTFIVVRDKAAKERLSKSYSRPWFTQTPVIVVACVSPEKAWKRWDGEEFWKVDAAIALQTLVLAATAEGLGTCWIGAFDEKLCKEALGIPRNVRVVAMTPLGYPAEVKPEVTERKSLAEFVRYDGW